ncbi:hypothetical protein ACFQX8_08025 [Klenkia terrae]|uniref:hypothetical protein n=1 Tax=Klenkia terrae TaxID=1052259 RepID=UPI0036191780
MTEGRAHFPIEAWALTETGIDHDSLAVNESVFALANGHIGMRGTLEEGEPSVVPGTYLNGFFEERPLPYAEAGYGFPEEGQTVVNVTDGKLIRLLVGDSPLDLDYGQIISHERTLDLRAGVLRRCTEWRSPNGRTVELRSTRLVSLTRRSIAAIRYEVRCTDDGGDLYVAIQSDLLANEVVENSGSDDPRAAAALRKPLQSELHTGRGRHAVLVHQTTTSRLRMAAGMDHDVLIPDSASEDLEVSPDLARYTLAARLPAGRSCGWSSTWPTAGPPGGPRPPSGTRWRAPSRWPSWPAGTAWPPSSASCWTATGRRPTSPSRATTSCSRPCGWACSTSCRPASARRSSRSRPRASPARATTGTRSGTPRPTSSRC